MNNPIDLEIENERLKTQLSTLRLENGELRARLAGDSETECNRWLQRRVHAQRVALHRLQTRVESQRFTLRAQERLGRGLSHDELAAARAFEAAPTAA